MRFVTRAISDASKSFYFEGRIGPLHARLYAETAVSAVARGAGMGRFFRDDQGETFEPDIAAHRSAVAVIGVVALDNGKWLIRQNGFSIDNPTFPTREAALRCSIARKIKDFRRFARQSDGVSWNDGFAKRMIEWALSLKPAQSRADSAEQKPATPLRDATIVDPVVAELVAQNKARKIYPAGHVIHHTMDYADPDKPMRVGACDCGASFAYRPSQHHEMDAAIEAHWQKFDALPEKVDGKGHPIVTEASPAAQSVAPEPAAAVANPASAGSLIPDDDPDWMLKLAEELAWKDEPELPEQILAARRGGVERPILRWHGGKWKLAPWLMGFFPDHRIYVEPFGGAGSVLMRKPRVYAEIYNDLDDVVVNLFRILRDDAKAIKLIEALRMTPFAREEFTDALEVAEDDVERARHLIVRSYMGFGSNAHAGSSTAEKTGFKSYTRPDDYRSTGFRANSNRSGTTPAHDWANYPDALPAIIERLRGVIVEQRPAIDVMRQHDGPATLHYVDPPYLPETRSPANKYDLKHRMYRHELTPDDHRELLAFLKTLEGFVVLSGYPSPLYEEALPEWRRETCAAHADGARDRTEVAWINPACAAALDHRHPALFDLAKFDEANAPPPLELEEAET